MELQFENRNLSCLRSIVCDTSRREETGELRLPENMPDAASVIAAWGQVILRGKEWRSGGLTVSGGVMVWVLYASEDTGEIHCVDTWLPLQFKCDFPDPGRDGQICAWGALESIDARLISARKIMARANISMFCRAWVKEKVSVPGVGELPQDAQILEQSYPVLVAREAGEQGFTMEESFSAPERARCIYYRLSPQITEHRVMGDKLVYRGVCRVHMLAMVGATPQALEEELPFSQFAELEEAYEETAEGYLVPVITGMELAPAEDGKWEIKCAISCQYTVTEREMLTLPTDGYSISRESRLLREELEIPGILQMEDRSQSVICAIDSDGLQVLDAVMTAAPGYPDRTENAYFTPLWSQVLYIDGEGRLRGESCRWEERTDMPAAEHICPGIYCETGQLQVTSAGGKTEVTGRLRLQEMTAAVWKMQVLAGAEWGESLAKDPNRPSLILRRMGEDGLWEVAKSCGTTVSAIEKANHLTTEPLMGTMLIVPVS